MLFFSAYQSAGEAGAAQRDGLGSGRAVGLQANRAQAIISTQQGSPGSVLDCPNCRTGTENDPQVKPALCHLAASCFRFCKHRPLSSPCPCFELLAM